MQKAVEQIRQPKFWKRIAALGPLVTDEELHGLPEYGSVEWMVMKAGQARFPAVA